MRARLSLLLLVGACAGKADTTPQPILPDGVDGGIASGGGDDGGSGGVNPYPPPTQFGSGRAGDACTTGADCAGGYCLGAAGQPLDGNPRFTGGYCSAIGCTLNTQDGCGPDEWCTDLGAFPACVRLCSKADGLVCGRDDQVCLGLGAFGGCFSKDAVECAVKAEPSQCQEGYICVRIGYEDATLGRCELGCNPLDNSTCTTGHACYYIRKYNAAFCGAPGTSQPEDTCSCDKCCIPGYGCTDDDDGTGRHCKPLCVVADPSTCSGGTCKPLDADPQSDGTTKYSPLGGCILPGSSGT